MKFLVKIKANKKFYEKTGLQESVSYTAFVESNEQTISGKESFKMIVQDDNGAEYAATYKKLNFLLEVNSIKFTPEFVVVESWANYLQVDDSFLCQATMYFSPAV
jgi:hypothetical protein